jgi:hypothetical protein
VAAWVRITQTEQAQAIIADGRKPNQFPNAFLDGRVGVREVVPGGHQSWRDSTTIAIAVVRPADLAAASIQAVNSTKDKGVRLIAQAVL